MSYSVVEYKAGEIVFQQGEAGTLMYLVQKGELGVLQEHSGTETQIAVLKRSDFFGEMSLLEKAPRTHTVRALSDSKLVKIDRGAFSQMLKRNPDIAVRMVRKLSIRLASAEDMIMRAFDSLASESTAVTDRPIAVKARLVTLNPQFAGLEFVLPDKPEVTIGRLDPVNNIHPDVDLTKIDPQISTSRRHAKIFCHGGSFQVQEEATTNGTQVNELRISAERSLEIRHGDEISFGAVRMRLVVE